MDKYRRLVLPASLFIASCVFGFPAYAAGDTMSKAEARQMREDATPQARYNTSKREAQAAYQEALAGCKKMSGADRTSCMKEARTNLQDDLAYAKNQLGSDTSVGTSGTTGSGASSGKGRTTGVRK